MQTSQNMISTSNIPLCMLGIGVNAGFSSVHFGFNLDELCAFWPEHIDKQALMRLHLLR